MKIHGWINCLVMISHFLIFFVCHQIHKITLRVSFLFGNRFSLCSGWKLFFVSLGRITHNRLLITGEECYGSKIILQFWVDGNSMINMKWLIRFLRFFNKFAGYLKPEMILDRKLIFEILMVQWYRSCWGRWWSAF